MKRTLPDPGAFSVCAELESRPGTGDVKGTTGTIEGGYLEVRYDARVKDSQLQILANGRTIGTYTQDVNSVYIGSMLRRGAMNTITFVFSSANPGNAVVLYVQPDVGHMQTVFNFTPKGGKLQDSFEVPFAGKKQ